MSRTALFKRKERRPLPASLLLDSYPYVKYSGEHAKTILENKEFVIKNPEQQKAFYEINKKADKVVYLAERYTGNEQYHARNRYLVDHASHLIAYCRDTQALIFRSICCIKRHKRLPSMRKKRECLSMSCRIHMPTL